MTKIFKDKKEPLYNRQSRFMTVRPFTPTVLKDILSEYNPGYTAEDLLALYAFTGGVAKYVHCLLYTSTAKAWLYSMGSGAMQETPKVQAHRVRPIITINE